MINSKYFKFTRCDVQRVKYLYTWASAKLSRPSIVWKEDTHPTPNEILDTRHLHILFSPFEFSDSPLTIRDKFTPPGLISPDGQITKQESS